MTEKGKQYLFKLELDMAYPQIGIYSKYFKTLKALNQWLKRNEDKLFTCIETRKYMLTDKGYERFYIFGNVIQTISGIQEIISNLKKSEKDKTKFIEDLKNRSTQI
jgi:hypothetical protein